MVLNLSVFMIHHLKLNILLFVLKYNNKIFNYYTDRKENDTNFL